MDNTQNMMDVDASRNTLLTIILVLLILITGAMIFNFYGMKFQVDSTNIPKCVGSDDLDLNLVERPERSKASKDNASSSGSESRAERVKKLIQDNVGDYRDGSYNPEIQREMIRGAQENLRKKLDAKKNDNQESPKAVPMATPKAAPKKIENMTPNGVKTDKPEAGKVKLCIYHMNGCGHCHDIMTVKQDNGMTKFEHLRKLFADKPNVEILDFQHGKDSEASKFGAFPVIMLVKDGSAEEYNRERTVEAMANFIVRNM
jgi:hypothetical protein